MNNFAVRAIAYTHYVNGLYICIKTNTPCHLSCFHTDKKPGRHKTSRRERGIDLPWGAYFCFVAWKEVEQQQAGDTLWHTFQIEPWGPLHTKWFAFRGLGYIYVTPPPAPPTPEDCVVYEPWGDTLNENYPWLPFTIPDIPEWTLEEGILTLHNPGFADCGIAYSPPYLLLPVLSDTEQPLRIITNNPEATTSSSSTQIHHELILRSATEVLSIYLAISLGAEWWHYKPQHHTRISGRDCGIYWIGEGYHDISLYDLFVKFRNEFGKSTDPTGWWLNDIVFVMSLGEEHRTDDLKSDYIGFYYPVPSPPIPVLSPSVSPIFEHWHPGGLPMETNLRVYWPGDLCNWRLTGTGPDCPDHWKSVTTLPGHDPDWYLKGETINSRWGYDSYLLERGALGKIKSITHWMKVKAQVAHPFVRVVAHLLRIDGSSYITTIRTGTTDWRWYSQEYTYNPHTGQQWTQEDLDNLQVGVGLRRSSAFSAGGVGYCDELYLSVERGIDCPP